MNTIYWKHPSSDSTVKNLSNIMYNLIIKANCFLIFRNKWRKKDI